MNSLNNMLAKIKNGQLSKKLFVQEEKTKNCEKCLKVLWKNGLILGYKNINGKLIVFLKYISTKPAINFFRIPRKQNKTIYLSLKQLWKLRINNNTLCVIATSKGLKSLKECKKEKLGGKLLAILS